MVDWRTNVFSAGVLALIAACIAPPSPSWAGQTGNESRRLADEQEMLAKARQEADERHRAGTRRLEGTVNIGEAPMAGDTAEARQREDELRRLSDKLRRASQMRPPRTVPPAVGGNWSTEIVVAPQAPAPSATYEAESRSALGRTTGEARERERDAARDTHATVLLVMTPGNRGIRRFEKTADPILCTNHGCYISNGSATAARYISLGRSLGFMTTFGPRAGECRNQTACVYRGVDVSAPDAILQPVDLRLVKHDRRAIKAALIDETCKVDAGRLQCARPIRGDDFVMWVVPETVAKRAGSEALRQALADGLPDTRRADLSR